MKPLRILSLAICCSLIMMSIAVSSCKKDKVVSDSNAKLSFSKDSILFDTVFTTIGSTTKLFTIHNPYQQTLKISRAYIANGNSSPFRINIDGSAGPVLQNIELLPNDSMYVFVQVTVNPTGVNSPLLIKDSIVFETNGNTQYVMLTAIGQDVHLHKPTVFPADGSAPYSLINCGINWTNDKPHLIFGYAVVNTDSVLTMDAGTKVYLNRDAVLKVNAGGSLIINGSKGNEVTFQGARLESEYSKVPGQWNKILLAEGSKNNIINWAIIKNGITGVEADGLGVSGVPLLTVTNTIIKNMTLTALSGIGTHIKSYNCVFANCGEYIASLVKGGNYNFQQCTFANYWNRGVRNSSLLYVSDYTISEGTTYTQNLDSAHFGNSIIYGTLSDEVTFDQYAQSSIFNYMFENCLVKTSINMTTAGIHYSTVYVNTDPLFVDTDKDNFTLQASSPAIDKGYSTGIIKDLNDKDRPNITTGIPDLGAYEFY